MMGDSTTTLSSSSGKSPERLPASSQDGFPSSFPASSFNTTPTPHHNSSTMQHSYVKNLLRSFYHRFTNGLKRISDSLTNEKIEQPNQDADKEKAIGPSPRSKRSLGEDLSPQHGFQQTSDSEKKNLIHLQPTNNKNNNKRIRHVMKKIWRQQQEELSHSRDESNTDKTFPSTNEDNNNRNQRKEPTPSESAEYKERFQQQGGGDDSSYDDNEDDDDDNNQVDSSSATNYYYKMREHHLKGEDRSIGSNQQQDSSPPSSFFPNGLSYQKKSSSSSILNPSDDMSINHLDMKNRPTNEEEEIIEKESRSPADHQVEMTPIISEFCYKTDDVLIVVAITCCLNFTFVLGIWASVRWLGVGTSSSAAAKRRKRRMMSRAASHNATMKMVAFTDDDVEQAFGENNSISIVGKNKYLKPNHCCLSYDEEDDLFYSSSSDDDDEDEEEDEGDEQEFDETYYYGTDVKDNLVFDNKMDNQRRVFWNKRLSSLRLHQAGPTSAVRKRSRSMEDLRCFNYLYVET